MNLTKLNRSKNLAIPVLMIFFLFNCKYNRGVDQWDKVEIYSGIAKDSIYKELDKQAEIFSEFEEIDSLMRRTSDVAYFSGEKINLKDDKNSKFNNCRAYFFHSDTLSVDIGIGNGFSGWGFIINYKNNKFYTEPYSYTDVIYEGEAESTYKIVYQKLTLDKPTYKLGDSLYGRIEFKSIEKTNFLNKTEHFAIGNFRTKVRKR